MTTSRSGERRRPAPGWYPDPAGRFELRWWNGSRWTGDVVREGRRESDRPPGTPGATGEQRVPRWPAGARAGLTTGRWTVPGHVGVWSSPASGPSRLPLGTRLLQLGGVYAVILTIVLGGVVSSAVVTEASGGAPVPVAEDVQVQPLSGWRQAQAEPGRVLLTRGSANLAVVAEEGVRGPAELAEQYLTRELRTSAVGPLVVSEAKEVHLDSGLRGQRFMYEGDFGEGGRTARVRGEVTAVSEPRGTGAVFDAWSSPEIFRYQEDDVHRMIETAEVR
jgi:hypothetical protein